MTVHFPFMSVVTFFPLVNTTLKRKLFKLLNIYACMNLIISMF